RLGVVLLRALLANLLAELPRSQELDEPGPEEDRDQHRRHPGDQDLAPVDCRRRHAGQGWAHRPGVPRCARSSSLTSSSPTGREPLTRTVSPGWIIASQIGMAACASGAQASGA